MRNSVVFCLMFICSLCRADFDFNPTANNFSFNPNTVLVVEKEATEQDRRAAEKFQHYYEKIYGDKLAIVDRVPDSKYIVFGSTPAAQKLLPEVDFGRFVSNEFLLRTFADTAMVIAGQGPAGTMRAVDDFFNVIVARNIQFYQTSYEVIRKEPSKRLRLPLYYQYAPCATDTVQTPSFQFAITKDTVIVCGPDATPAEKNAAAELQKYLKKITGLTLVVEQEKNGKSSILVGQGAEAQAADEIIIDTLSADTLILTGARPRGSLYAVYSFLEKYFGVLFLSPDYEVIPENYNPVIPEVHFRHAPKFLYRQTTFVDGNSPESIPFLVKNKLNGTMFIKFTIPEEWGGVYQMDMAHTGDTKRGYIRAAEFFETHPEYFAYREESGKREDKQLCYSNPEVRKLITEKVLALREKNPQKKFISFAAADNDKICQCPECKEMNRKSGTPGAGVYLAANETAKALREKYPDTNALVQAYWTTRKRPTDSTAEPNLWIGMGILNRSHGASMSYGTANTYFSTYKYLNGKRMFTWEYFANFTYYALPMPNLYEIPRTIKMYALLESHGIFAQLPRGKTADFAAFRMWLAARCLWEPDTDIEAAVDLFFEHYYGKGAPYLKEYIRLRKSTVQAKFVSCYAKTASYLSPAEHFQCLALLDEALKATADSKIQQQRCRFVKFGLVLAVLLDYDKMKQWADSQGVTIPEYGILLQELSAIHRESGDKSAGEPHSYKKVFLDLSQKGQ